ncbi:MAG: hypothetical protein MUC36_07210 [Planctomycetes bacterium]|jgi:hypothetical protein|nr:hypothetical protein [Planctomycetota bacterium]
MTARRLAGAIGLLCLAACGGPVPPWTEAPAALLDLKITVEPTEVQLLQPVTVVLDRWRRDGVEAEFAPAVDAADFDASTTVAPERPLLGGHWQRTTLQLLPLRGPGELLLPSFTVRERAGAGASSTPEQRVQVVSALADRGAGIEVAGEPFATPFRGWWWLGGGAAAIAALGLALAMWRRRAAAVPPDAIAVPPHVKAHRALQRLHKAPRGSEAEVDAFYVELSGVLRVYLEERFGLCAPERTTEEFLAMLEHGDGLCREHRAELERFLRQCDLVKFAAAEPGENDHLATWALASAFVEATRADAAAAPAAAAEVRA